MPLTEDESKAAQLKLAGLQGDCAKAAEALEQGNLAVAFSLVRKLRDDAQAILDDFGD